MCNSDEDCLPTLKCIERKCQLPHQQNNGDGSKCSVKPNGMNLWKYLRYFVITLYSRRLFECFSLNIIFLISVPCHEFELTSDKAEDDSSLSYLHFGSMTFPVFEVQNSFGNYVLQNDQFNDRLVYKHTKHEKYFYWSNHSIGAWIVRNFNRFINRLQLSYYIASLISIFISLGLF